MKSIISTAFGILFFVFPLFSQDIQESSKLLELINSERKKAGLEAYQTSKDLKNAAAVRAEEISKIFESKRPDGSEIHTIYSEYGMSAVFYGESIRTGYETADGIFRAMIKEDLSSILDTDYTHIGIGIYKNAKNIYWAILYCSLAN